MFDEIGKLVKIVKIGIWPWKFPRKYTLVVQQLIVQEHSE